MRLREQRVQRKLITSADGLDHLQPSLLGDGRLRFVGVEQIPEG